MVFLVRSQAKELFMSSLFTDSETLLKPDQSGMLESVKAAPERAKMHFHRGLEHPLQMNPKRAIQQILVCGMGGSGSTGDLLQVLCAQSIIQITVQKSSQLPAWVNAETLVIGVSYSGETSETLSCVEAALAQGAQLHLLASGGVLQVLAETEKLVCVPIEGGLPPRAALFDMLFALLGSLLACPVIAQRLGLNQTEVEASLPFLAQLSEKWYLPSQFDASLTHLSNLPYGLARSLQGLQPLIWAADAATGVIAQRWKNQLSENAKTLASWSAMPELNHNEMVAMCALHHSQIRLLYLNLGSVELLANKVSLEMVGPHISGLDRIMAEGKNHFERVLFLTYLGDFISVYLALLNKIDPTPIEAINEFKRRISHTSP
jgi:glucose/mannose-6-phosphate isomerase